MFRVSVSVLCLLLSSTAALGEDVIVSKLIQSTHSWNSVSLPDFTEKETEATMLRISIPPHTKLPMHYHPVINVAYMLSGELTVIKEKGESIVLKKGDPLIELVNQNHYGANTTDLPAEILVVYIGQEGEPVTVKSVP